MCFELPFISKSEHFIVYTCWITYAQHIDSTVNKLLTYPVYSHITLCTDHHLALSHQCFVDGFNQRCGLSCTWRTMNHSHILCPQNLVHSLFLCWIQPRQTNRSERKLLNFLSGIEQITQISKSIAPCFHRTIQCIKHHSIACFVETQLTTFLFCS